MFYQEKMIDGIMHFRTDPNGEWRPYTLESLSSRYNTLKKEHNEYLTDDIGNRYKPVLREDGTIGVERR